MGKKAAGAPAASVGGAASVPPPAARPKSEPKAKAAPAGPPGASGPSAAAATAKQASPPAASKAGLPPAKAAPKATAAAPAPPPEPVRPEEVGDDAEAAKKKKNRRGGRGKKGDEPGSPSGEGPMSAERAAEVAEAKADQDPDLAILRASVAELEGQAAAAVAAAGARATVPGQTQAVAPAKAALEAFITDLDKRTAAKKASLPRRWQPSHKLAEQLVELRDAGQMDMAKEVQAQVEESEVAEVCKALIGKFALLKARVEKAQQAVQAAGKPRSIYAASSNIAAPSATGGKGSAAAAAANEAASRAAQEDRLQSRLRDRASVRGLGEDASGAKLHTKTLELSPEVTKYLVSPPTRFIARFEREYLVVVEGVRPPKGSGKGGKGPVSTPPAVPKELVVAAYSGEEVEKCCAALKALDFSGTQTREVDRSVRIRELEQEHGVITFKDRSSLTVYGPKAKVDAAFASADEMAKKAEGERFTTDTVALDADKVKALTSGGPKSVLSGWRNESEVKIRVVDPQADEEHGTAAMAKVLLSAKSQADVDAMKKKVQDFVKATAVEFLEADVSKLYESRAFRAGDSVEIQLTEKGRWMRAKVEQENDDHTFSILCDGEDEPVIATRRQIRRQEAYGDGGIARRFRELCDASGVMVRRREGGLQLVGKKSEMGALKAGIIDLLKKASYEPQKITLLSEQARVFHRDNLAHIEKLSGADVRRSDITLVLVGDDEQIEKAKEAIDEVIRKEGSIEKIDVSEEIVRALKGGGGAKIKELEARLNVYLSVPRQALQVIALGSASAVQAAKHELVSFVEQIEKEQGETVVRELRLNAADIPRVIGTKGSTLQNIRRTCGVQVTIHDETSTVEIKGAEADVTKAEKAISDLLEATEEKASAAAKARAGPTSRPRKKAEEFKGSAADFPTLGGAGAESEEPAEAVAKPAVKWGSKAPPKERDGAQDTAAAFPSLAAAASVQPVAQQAPQEPEAVEDDAEAQEEEAQEEAQDEAQEEEEAQDEEAQEEEAQDEEAAAEEGADKGGEEEACDFDDPFAMMGGMGEEEVYKVTCMQETEEAPTPAVAPAPEPKPVAAAPATAAAPAAPAAAGGPATAATAPTQVKKQPEKEFNLAADFPALGGSDFPALGGSSAKPSTRPAWGARK